MVNPGHENPPGTISWWRWKRKHNRQLGAMIPGCLLLLAGGIHLGWTLFNVDQQSEPWASASSSAEVLITHTAWFAGTIVGGFNGSYFVDSIGRWRILRPAIVSLLGSGMLMAIFPKSIVAILFGRLLAGYAHGLVYLAEVILAAEIAVAKQRGYVTSFIHLSTVAGILTFTVFNAFVIEETRVDKPLLIGIVTIGITLLAIPFYWLLGFESPIYLMMKNRDTEALEMMKDLRKEKIIETETRNDFRDLQQTVHEDVATKRPLFRLRSLYVMLFVKFVQVISFNLPFNQIRIAIAKRAIGSLGMFHIQPVILMMVRLLVGFVPMLAVDHVGRRFCFTWTTKASAFFLFIAALVVAINKSGAVVPIILFEITSGLGVGIAADTFAGEAFPTYSKGVAFGFLNFVENVLQLVLYIVGFYVTQTFNFKAIYLFVTSGLLATVAMVVVPNTAGMTLKIAQNAIANVRLRCCN